MNITRIAFIVIISGFIMPYGFLCQNNKLKSMSKETHSKYFFPFLNPQDILRYKYTFSLQRGSYVTIAKAVTSTNIDILFRNNIFTNIVYASSDAEKTRLNMSMRIRAASLLGRTNCIPIWMNPKKDDSYDYTWIANGSVIEKEMWWNMRDHTIYLIACGDASEVKTLLSGNKTN